MPPRSVLVAGAGAVGCYAAACLAATGHRVELVGRGRALSLAGPLVIDGSPFPMPPVVAAPSPGGWDVALVAVKAPDLAAAIGGIDAAGADPAILATVQNGIVEDAVLGRWASHPGRVPVKVFSGYRLDGATLTTFPSPRGWLVPDGRPGVELADLLRDAGIPCRATPEFARAVAEKMLLNVTLNALSALERASLGQILDSGPLGGFVSALFDECHAVLAHDHPLPPLAEAKAEFLAALAPMRSHYSSMYRDAAAGRSTEVDQLNGHIVRRGRALGLPTPLNDRICANFEAGCCSYKATPFCLSLCRLRDGECHERGCPGDDPSPVPLRR